MIRELALLVLLGGHPDEIRHARRELDAVATRIEQLKARQLEGQNVRGELEALLVRAQEIALELERSLALDGPVPARDVPSSDELRERADLARDEADRIAIGLDALEYRIAMLRHDLQVQAMRGVSDAERHRRLRHLLEQRAALVERHRDLHADAGRLEAEADVIDGEATRPRGPQPAGPDRVAPGASGPQVRTVNTR
jgi:hypothetical protein